MHVVGVSEFPEPRYTAPDLNRGEVGERYIGEIIPQCAVLEDRKVVPGPEKALLEGFSRLVFVHEPFNAFESRRELIPKLGAYLFPSLVEEAPQL